MRYWLAGVSGFLMGAFTSSSVLAEWTPLITSGDFTGIKTDLGVAVIGVLSLMLIILGVGIVIRMISK
jgi:hypothetical protein